jgi:hypothetical protein
LGKDQGLHSYPAVYPTAYQSAGAAAQAIGQEKEIQDIQSEREDIKPSQLEMI